MPRLPRATVAVGNPGLLHEVRRDQGFSLNARNGIDQRKSVWKYNGPVAGQAPEVWLKNFRQFGAPMSTLDDGGEPIFLTKSNPKKNGMLLPPSGTVPRRPTVANEWHVMQEDLWKSDSMTGLDNIVGSPSDVTKSI